MNEDEKERTADVVDQAQDIQQALNDAALDRSQQALKPERSEDFDGKSCVDCGDEIPVERLAWHRIRCTRCQQIIESRGKFYGG